MPGYTLGFAPTCKRYRVLQRNLVTTAAAQQQRQHDTARCVSNRLQGVAQRDPRATSEDGNHSDRNEEGKLEVYLVVVVGQQAHVHEVHGAEGRLGGQVHRLHTRGLNGSRVDVEVRCERGIKQLHPRPTSGQRQQEQSVVCLVVCTNRGCAHHRVGRLWQHVDKGIQVVKTDVVDGAAVQRVGRIRREVARRSVEDDSVLPLHELADRGRIRAANCLVEQEALKQGLDLAPEGLDDGGCNVVKHRVAGAP
jgi:hypothetical protein